MSRVLVPILLLLAAMASIQTGAAVAKGLFPLLSATGVTALRLLFAAVVLWAVFRPWRSPPARASWPPLLGYGAALGCMNLLFYLAIARVPLGVGVALEFTGPLAVALIGSRRATDLVWAALAAAGVFLLSPFARGSVPVDPLGALFALAAGACWALYILFGRQAGSAHGPAAAAWGMAIAALVAAPAGALLAGPKLIHLEAWPAALLVAVLSSALPYTLEMLALRRTPAALFGVMMSVEPAMGALSGL